MSNFFKLYLIMFLFWGGGSVIGFAFGSSNLSHFITNISVCFQIMKKKKFGLSFHSEVGN